jgi:hypothetical protein
MGDGEAAMNGVSHHYSKDTTAHVGALLDKKDVQAREVYRIEYYSGLVYVSDMLDEGHFLQPTIEKVTATPATYKGVMTRLVKKYEQRLSRMGY